MTETEARKKARQEYEAKLKKIAEKEKAQEEKIIKRMHRILKDEQRPDGRNAWTYYWDAAQAQLDQEKQSRAQRARSARMEQTTADVSDGLGSDQYGGPQPY